MAQPEPKQYLPNKQTLFDVGKGLTANLSAFIIAAGATIVAWQGMGGPLPAWDYQIAELGGKVSETQAWILNEKLLDHQRELRDVKQKIDLYRRSGETAPQIYIDHRETLIRQIYEIEQRLRKLGINP